jgi:hypothetical protein
VERNSEKKQGQADGARGNASAAAQARQAGGAGGKRRLTERDRQILGFLGIARYLSTEQIGELVFPSREESVPRKRLHKLAEEGGDEEAKGFVRRLSFRTYEGEIVVVWALGPAGHPVAEKVLGRALPAMSGDVGAEFLAHDIALNQLLVALAKGEHGDFSRVDESRFRWVQGDALRLPFAEYDMAAGRSRARLLQPDAVLEFPASRRRYFLECEMGTHSIEARSDEKTGSTIAKIERYAEYMNGFAEVSSRTTYYARSFADQWPAGLVFLVPTAARRDHILEAVGRWRAGRAGAAIGIKAFTFAEGAGEFRDGPDAPARAQQPATQRDVRPAIEKAEVETLWSFFDQAIGGLKSVRAAVRGLNARAGHVLTVPEYPENSDEVRELLCRMRARTQEPRR